LVKYFSPYDKNVVASLFLDNRMRLIDIKKLYDLDFESGGVKARPFVDEAIRRRAAVVITAHNHPFGPFYPSPGNRETNTMITNALAMSGIVHAEHYIVSGDKHAGIGSIKNFLPGVSQTSAVSEFFEGKDRLSGKVLQVGFASPLDTNREICLFSGYISESLGYFKELLSYCVGKNASKLATELLSKYSTIENVFTASAGELESVCGEKCTFYIKLLAYITSRRRTESFSFGIRHTKVQIAEYLKAIFLGESIEKTYLISFDAEGRTVGINLLSEGTVNSSEILPRKAMEIAINSSARNVSLAHNHPFGTTKASIDDINISKHFSMLFA
jgi:DNA repair protein RadC